MPALVYIAENSQNVSYPLTKGVFTVGSRDDSQLQLPSNQIAAEHASIIYEDGHYVLHDHNSDSGTFVNGERVTKMVLKHNDILRFGEYRFRVYGMESVPLMAVNNTKL